MAAARQTLPKMSIRRTLKTIMYDIFDTIFVQLLCYLKGLISNPTYQGIIRNLEIFFGMRMESWRNLAKCVLAHLTSQIDSHVVPSYLVFFNCVISPHGCVIAICPARIYAVTPHLIGYLIPDINFSFLLCPSDEWDTHFILFVLILEAPCLSSRQLVHAYKSVKFGIKAKVVLFNQGANRLIIFSLLRSRPSLSRHTFFKADLPSISMVYQVKISSTPQKR